MKEKITIGLFTDVFFPMTDGVVMVVDNYAKRLAKYANVIVFAPKMKKKFDDSIFNYKVVRCSSIKVPIIDYSLPIPKVDSKFKHEIDKYKLDIVHIHSPFTIGKYGINYAKSHHIPVIGTMHSQYKQDFLRATNNEKLSSKLTKILINNFNKCDECWAVNQEVARIYYEEYGYKEMPKVMNNATEMMPTDKIEARKYINDLYKINDKDKVFLFVGRINNLKNVFFIAKSLYILKQMKPKFKFKMLFVGCGQDENKLKEIIKKNNMVDDIIMCGKVTDRDILAKYYSRADLFLFPSLYDASSIVQIEAASQMTPTLFIKGAATTCTVSENINGFISENDINLYAKKIDEIMSNQNLYDKVSSNAYKDLYKNWDDTILDVYQKYLEHIQKYR